MLCHHCQGDCSPRKTAELPRDSRPNLKMFREALRSRSFVIPQHGQRHPLPVAAGRTVRGRLGRIHLLELPTGVFRLVREIRRRIATTPHPGCFGSNIGGVRFAGMNILDKDSTILANPSTGRCRTTGTVPTPDRRSPLPVRSHPLFYYGRSFFNPGRVMVCSLSESPTPSPSRAFFRCSRKGL